MLEVLLLAWLVQVVIAEDAVAQGASPVNPGLFEQYGPITIVASVFATLFWIMFQRYEKTVDLERQRAARLEQEVRDARAEVRDLEKSFREQAVPAFMQSAQMVAEVIKFLEKRRRDGQ